GILALKAWDRVNGLIPRRLSESTNRIKPAATGAVGAALEHATTERHGGWGGHCPVHVVVVRPGLPHRVILTKRANVLAVLDIPRPARRVVNQLSRARIGLRNIVGQRQLLRRIAATVRPVGCQASAVHTTITRTVPRGHGQHGVFLLHNTGHSADDTTTREAQHPTISERGLSGAVIMLADRTQATIFRLLVHLSNSGRPAHSARPLRAHNRLATRQRES